MARYTGAVCRLCRREGGKLFLKGDRCYTGKCAVDKRSYPPGQHGQGRTKASEHGTQLREKQKTKRYYGILERQFHGYFELAKKRKGQTGENLLSILESRLDNVAYRLGFGASRAEARQLVRHGHFLVDGKKVNIPSFLVRPGMMISIKPESRQSEKIKGNLEASAGRTLPRWLELDGANHVAKIVAVPTKEDIDLPIAEHLIVELYSK